MLSFHDFIQESININQQPNNFDSIFNIVDQLAIAINKITDPELKTGLVSLTKQYRDKLNLINAKFSPTQPNTITSVNRPRTGDKVAQYVRDEVANKGNSRQLPQNVLDSIFSK